VLDGNVVALVICVQIFCKSLKALFGFYLDLSFVGVCFLG